MEIQQLLPYPYYIVCVFNKAQHDELCEQLNLQPFGDWDEPENNRAVASAQFYARDEWPRKLGVMSFYDAEFDICSVAHEGVHVMSDLMHRIGITYDPLNDEPYAYQLEQIMYFARHKYNELHGPMEQVEKAIIATGNHPVIDVLPLSEEDKAQRIAKLQITTPQFTLNDLNSGDNNFLDDK